MVPLPIIGGGIPTLPNKRICFLIDPGKFCKVVIQPGSSVSKFFPFSISESGLAAELRRFADAIDVGTVVPQRIQTGVVAQPSEYAKQAIMIEFAEVKGS